MNTYPLTEADYELVDAARATITRLYKEDRHHVGAALRTMEGKIVTAVHIEAYIGRVTVCAEAIAIGKAASDGETHFETIVAVRHPYSDEQNRELQVVSPCGICRELISDYAPDCFVVLEMNGALCKMQIRDLIPLKYQRNA